MLKKKVIFILKLVVSIGLILILISNVDTKNLLTNIRKVNIFLFGCALSLSTLTILIRSYKWKLLLQVQGASLSLNKIQAISYMSLFFNNFFLGTFGGDAFRIYKTMNYLNFKGSAIASVIMDRFTGVTSIFLVLFLSSIGELYIEKTYFMQEQLYAIIIFSLIILIVIYAIFKFFIKFSTFTGFLKLSNFSNIIDSFIHSITIYQKHRKTVLMCLLLSTIFQIVKSIAMFFFALSANVNINFMHLIFIIPIVTLVLMIPISLNGIGLHEGAFFFYFEKIGIDSSSALLIAFLPRIAMFILSLIGALIYMLEGILKDHQG